MAVVVGTLATQGHLVALSMIFLTLVKNFFVVVQKGIYYSTDEGRCWHSRYTGSSCGKFQQLAADGSRILATTEKGLYYSTDGGRCWHKR